MLRSMYSAVSGMRGFQTKLDVIGNNIANVNTVGFKKSRVMFQDVLSQNLSGATVPQQGTRGGVNPRQVGLGVQIGAIDTLHTPGSPMTTGVLTDLAIAGDGFFLVSPDGNPDNFYLTRAGNFTLDAEGQLVTADGYFVLGTDGVITIPQGQYVAYDITRNGSIVGYDQNGNANVLANLEIAFVNNPGGLRKVGGSLYEMTVNAHPNGQPVRGSLDQLRANIGLVSEIYSGMLEMSNVDLTEEFTEMIVAQRGFQANSRIITTSDEILQEVVNLKR
ncbi:flagellar basal-body rod protein FlgG [Caldalkalibacillus thermarum]|uniref:flagellar hook-basal body complex protein n=1 Tax=Caldalkalibacillus thermarum TaxID=296745 RepID=UPI00166D84A0|nr:flagellar hook-basal body complex protein [Caldalkalibacillus thermarum]GGK13702.1 flagellar basal-body rod protein FlgG [Caldalkalibacillus thermarum]